MSFFGRNLTQEEQNQIEKLKTERDDFKKDLQEQKESIDELKQPILDALSAAISQEKIHGLTDNILALKGALEPLKLKYDGLSKEYHAIQKKRASNPKNLVLPVEESCISDKKKAVFLLLDPAVALLYAFGQKAQAEGYCKKSSSNNVAQKERGHKPNRLGR